MKKRQIVTAAVVGLIVVIFFAYTVVYASQQNAPQEASDQSAIQAISPDEALELMEGDPFAAFVDVRTVEEYDEAHIPSALNVPLESIGDEPPEALPHQDLAVIVYCRTGVRSQQAAEKLKELGYTDVYDMGGIVDWPYETISTEVEQAEFAKEYEDSSQEELADDGAGDEPADESSPVPEPIALLPKFASEDLEGNQVDESILKNAKLTMLNIWATYCGPCLNEMPELGQLAADLKDQGVQIVGLVTDVLKQDGAIDRDQVDFARQVVEETGADYTHILPSQDLINAILWQVSAVPTTVFLDESGNMIGYAYTGSRPYDDWKAIIDETLTLLPTQA